MEIIQLCAVFPRRYGKVSSVDQEDGILAGVEVAKRVFGRFDPTP